MKARNDAEKGAIRKPPPKNRLLLHILLQARHLLFQCLIFRLQSFKFLVLLNNMQRQFPRHQLVVIYARSISEPIFNLYIPDVPEIFIIRNQYKLMT